MTGSTLPESFLEHFLTPSAFLQDKFWSLQHSPSEVHSLFSSIQRSNGFSFFVLSPTGAFVGLEAGASVDVAPDDTVGTAVIDPEGSAVGSDVGSLLAKAFGDTVGVLVGASVGCSDSTMPLARLGLWVGKGVGSRVGERVGLAVVVFVGLDVGEAVGLLVSVSTGVNDGRLVSLAL